LTINPTSGGSMDVTVTTQNFLPSETMVSVTDQAPYTPSNPDPYDGETGILLDQILSWTGGDPQGDSVSYDVYFGTTNPPGYVATVSVESFDPDITNLNTEHFWQIIADDGNGHTTDGPVWSFTTLSDNNMILENAEAYPGQIQAPVEVSGSWDQTITAYQIHVAYDTTYLDFSTVDFIGSIGEFADMGAWSFEPQPGLIVFGAMWLWGSEPAGTGLLGKILFNVSGSVPIDTVIPLNFTIYNTDPSFYTDVSGFNFFPDLIDGSLTISEFADTNPPAISNIQATPNPQDKDGSVTISCDVTDDSAVSQVNVIITGPPGYTPLNTSMTYDGGSSYSYSDSYSILGDYTYNIWAQDAHGNSGSSSVYGFTISDMTPPDITDMTPSTASTGDSFTFTADITDNVGVSNAFVEYWYGSGTHTNEEMQYSGGQYQKTITVDHTTELLYYIISAVDNYDNWDYTTTLDVFVYDNDVPSIDSVTGDISGETGQTTMVTVGFSDNIGVTEAILYYKSASAPGYSSKSILSGSAGIDIPADSIESWYYYVTVDDAAGNGPVGDPSVDGSSYYIISVTDSIAPVISSITGSTTGTTGETTTITTSFSDNIGVSEATLYYKSASAGGYSSTSILSGSADILLPIDSVEEWYYYVTVDDSAGNGPVGDPSVDGSMYYTISVSDNDAPQITDVDDFPDPQTVNFSHNITCTVTDNIGVGLVEVEITYPDLSVQTYPMAAVGGDTYKFELTYETPGNYTYVIYAEDTSANPQMSSEQEFTIEPGAFCGDANGDGIVNVGDAVYVISYVFKGGPAPVPYCRGDANGDGAVNVGDGVYIINYVFKGGPPPADICCP